MLQAKKLCMRYDDTVAIKDLSFTVAPGEIFCLLGQNGAGKTTTINIFLGLIEPTSGEAFINNNSVTKNKSAKKSIAYIPEVVQLYGNLSGELLLKSSTNIVCCSPAFPLNLT
ncbi:MAG: ATP-binding cassette domain-containing protein [Kordia sp.]|uniref:ATP-binding cassette domain-containing protein n=1 Tax=Kordia sp. TaxID=1965332 RepID=UPI00385D6C61